MENKQPIPTYLKWVIAGLIIWGILMTFLTVNKNDYAESQRIEAERALRKVENLQDSIRVVAREFAEQDLRSIKLIQELTIKDQRHEAEILKLTKDHDKIRFIRTTSDSQRDSLLSVALKN